MHDPQALLEFAVSAAHEAGELTLRYFQQGVPIETKSDASPVTIADRMAEELLRKRILAAYPDHGVLGEEFGETIGRAPARWILDPIDGTVSFVSGVPLYAVLMGLEWEGEVIVGAIHLPGLAETVAAARGLGCWWNGRRCHVSDVSDLSRARMMCTSPRSMYRHHRGAAYERLRDAVTIERGWSDAYAYALVATGRAEFALDPIMNLWDNAALFPVVREAGGTFTDWKGTSTHTAPEAVATNGHLFHAVMAVLNQ